MNKISVAICTYNGAKYVKQQLDSIINQTLRVNEIVVGDDGSSDDTIGIIEEIRNEYTEIEWNIIINKPGLGCCANFDDTIKRCTGDIIFLSDQDDIWDSKKVESIVKWFELNPQKDVVFSTFGVRLLANKHIEVGRLHLFVVAGYIDLIEQIGSIGNIFGG